MHNGTNIVRTRSPSPNIHSCPRSGDLMSPSPPCPPPPPPDTIRRPSVRVQSSRAMVVSNDSLHHEPTPCGPDKFDCQAPLVPDRVAYKLSQPSSDLHWIYLSDEQLLEVAERALHGLIAPPLLRRLGRREVVGLLLAHRAMESKEASHLMEPETTIGPRVSNIRNQEDSYHPTTYDTPCWRVTAQHAASTSALPRSLSAGPPASSGSDSRQKAYGMCGRGTMRSQDNPASMTDLHQAVENIETVPNLLACMMPRPPG